MVVTKREAQGNGKVQRNGTLLYITILYRPAKKASEAKLLKPSKKFQTQKCSLARSDARSLPNAVKKANINTNLQSPSHPEPGRSV